MEIKAEIIADSINPNGNRITTFVVTYPRFILAELNTHRALSKNSASSRAIPIEKMLKMVEHETAVPVRWGKNGKGMQDHGAFEGFEAARARGLWVSAAESALYHATRLRVHGLHKSIVNRVLEPFAWMTTLITATEWENFFALRMHKDAQPEFQRLAYLMLKAYLASTPVGRHWDDWHIPFADRMPDVTFDQKLKIATARAARVSYLTMDGEIDVAKDIELHDKLLASGHMSPFEHCAQADYGESYFGNFRGWCQYRKTLPGENRKVDLHRLLREYESSLTEGAQ